MQVLYRNWDALDVTFHGKLPAAILDALDAAKREAQERKGPVSLELGGVPVVVEETGVRGFSFMFRTGPDGEIWWARRTARDDGDWILRASVRAAAFAQYGGLDKITETLYRRLDAWGFRSTASPEGYHEAVGRVDFAIDFRAPDFRLEPENIVTRARKEGHLEAGVHWRGRRVSGVSVGKMPGRAVVIYDKGLEAREKQADFWPEVWGIEAPEPGEVWRVEMRLGKDELRERWGLRSIADLERAAGDAFADLVGAVRYCVPEGENVTRWSLAPLWRAVVETVRAGLDACRAGLAPGRVVETTRQRARQTFLQMWRGMAVSYAVIMGRSTNASDLEGLAREVAGEIGQYALTDPRRVKRKRDAALARYRFITEADIWARNRPETYAAA